MKSFICAVAAFMCVSGVSLAQVGPPSQTFSYQQSLRFGTKANWRWTLQAEPFPQYGKGVLIGGNYRYENSDHHDGVTLGRFNQDASGGGQLRLINFLQKRDRWVADRSYPPEVFTISTKIIKGTGLVVSEAVNNPPLDTRIKVSLRAAIKVPASSGSPMLPGPTTISWEDSVYAWTIQVSPTGPQIGGYVTYLSGTYSRFTKKQPGQMPWVVAPIVNGNLFGAINGKGQTALVGVTGRTYVTSTIDRTPEVIKLGGTITKNPSGTFKWNASITSFDAGDLLPAINEALK